ncbi:MAG: histidinol dehydrogenase [Bacillota bacterium]|nr:histidinol dehydrogenase [Bacillota bacterium]
MNLRILKSGGKDEREFMERLNKRSAAIGGDILRKVEKIIEQVEKDGDAALYEYTKRFDGVDLLSLEVTHSEFENARRSVDPELVEVMRRAAENITKFHEKQKQTGYRIDEDGVVCGQIIRPLERAGIYVPGGTAAYPSSVLMNAIPAKVAGVSEIVMVTPPGKDGTVPANILMAAEVAGIDKIYKVGGAQAIAALAYGTESIPKVDVIVGPGNIFVATAKKLVFGKVKIDMIAGPSEILIVADESADPAYLAADMMSQAEHDVLASSVLLCLSEKQAKAVTLELKKQIETLPRAEYIEKSLKDYGAIIVCSDLDDCVRLANEISPEHLELMVKEPFVILPEIKNAGSIFLGENAPEPLGDYMAGPNHVLPTSGTARFSSPLSVDCFIKKSSYLYYDKNALDGISKDVMRFAASEGLDAHANSIKVRVKDNEQIYTGENKPH